MEQDLGKDSSSPVAVTSTATNFSAVLDIIFSLQENRLKENHTDAKYTYEEREQNRAAKKLIDHLTNRSLRLTCKAAKSSVDFHVTFFQCAGTSFRCCGPCFFAYYFGKRNISSWPWPNIEKFFLFRCVSEGGFATQEDFELLVKVPLAKLEFLSLQAVDFSPLAKSNWPMLTYLDLAIMEGRSLVPSYRSDLQFPRFSLKKIQLGFHERSVRSEDRNTSQSCAFLGPLLRSCPEITELEIDSHSCIPEDMAREIASATLPNLSTLLIDGISIGCFYHNLFHNKEWATLKELTLARSCNENVLSLPAYQNWVTNLEVLVINDNRRTTGHDLRTLLENLQRGAIQRLQLKELQFTLFMESFTEGINLGQLTSLSLEFIRTKRYCNGADISAFINILFESCSLPSLELLDIVYWDEAVFERREYMPQWLQPPNVASKQLIESFSKLKEFTLRTLNMSHKVFDYLSTFMEATGCKFQLTRRR